VDFFQIRLLRGGKNRQAIEDHRKTQRAKEEKKIAGDMYNDRGCREKEKGVSIRYQVMPTCRRRTWCGKKRNLPFAQPHKNESREKA